MHLCASLCVCALQRSTLALNRLLSSCSARDLVPAPSAGARSCRDCRDCRAVKQHPRICSFTHRREEDLRHCFVTNKSREIVSVSPSSVLRCRWQIVRDRRDVNCRPGCYAGTRKHSLGVLTSLGTPSSCPMLAGPQCIHRRCSRSQLRASDRALDCA